VLPARPPGGVRGRGTRKKGKKTSLMGTNTRESVKKGRKWGQRLKLPQRQGPSTSKRARKASLTTGVKCRTEVVFCTEATPAKHGNNKKRGSTVRYTNSRSPSLRYGSNERKRRAAGQREEVSNWGLTRKKSQVACQAEDGVPFW